MIPESITIFGSGNVAWHLAYCCKKAGVNINFICGRNADNAKELANYLGTKYCTSVHGIPKDTSLVLVCVSDNAIEEVIEELYQLKLPVAHSAGSVPLSVFKNLNDMVGVFYPFQTFTKGVRMGGVRFPVCVESKHADMLILLRTLGGRIAERVLELDSIQRKNLHLTGVITNNFVNHLFTLSYDFLATKNIPAEILKPIICETVEKLDNYHPNELQTGPARRGNDIIIKEHLKMLQNNKNLQDIYDLFSKSIKSYYNKENE